MNLVFIYGPPAAGKLTVASELAELTEYELLDNHKTTDHLPNLFKADMPGHRVLNALVRRKVRLILFEAATEHDLSIITTFAPVFDGGHDFIRAVHESVEAKGGNVCLVHLLPPLQTLEQRVVGDSRTGGKARSVEQLHELIDAQPAIFETFPDKEH